LGVSNNASSSEAEFAIVVGFVSIIVLELHLD
jgi:hypothetical protein